MLEKLKLVFDPNTIEHLGISLYSKLPSVLSELISNSWDADADTVLINFAVSENSKEIHYTDDGNGMDFQELQEKGLIQLVVIPHVGCEKFAEYICKKIAPQIEVNSNERVKLMSVEVREHSGNSAIYIND